MPGGTNFTTDLYLVIYLTRSFYPSPPFSYPIYCNSNTLNINNHYSSRFHTVPSLTDSPISSSSVLFSSFSSLTLRFHKLKAGTAITLVVINYVLIINSLTVRRPCFNFSKLFLRPTKPTKKRNPIKRLGRIPVPFPGPIIRLTLTFCHVLKLVPSLIRVKCLLFWYQTFLICTISSSEWIIHFFTVDETLINNGHPVLTPRIR